MNPTVKLPARTETGERTTWTPRPWGIQEWLWECYESDMASVKELAAGDPIVLIVNGDITWGRKHPDNLVSTRDVDQFLIAIADLGVWGLMPNVTTMRLIHGTESHEFGQGTAPELVAAQLRLALPGRDIKTARHGLFDVDGVVFDCAHHGSGSGIRTWLKANVAHRYTRSMMIDAIKNGEEPPDVVLRSHFHEYLREPVVERTRKREYETIFVLTPAYCGMTHYALKVTRFSYMLGCGLVVFSIDDGKLGEIYPFVRTVDLRTEEAL